MTDSECQLVDLYLDGVLPESEHALLFQRLEADPEALVYLASRTQLNVDLRRSFKRRKLQQMAVAGAATIMVRQPRSVWFSWRPLTAAAAGIVLGMFCTSVVWAYAGAESWKAKTLLREDFETAEQPEVKGMPSKFTRWGGDRARIVEADQGVTPHAGRKMLQLMRADFEGEKATGSRACDQVRVIDLGGHSALIDSGSAVLSASAWFWMTAGPTDEPATMGLSISAFAQNPMQHGMEEWESWLDKERLGFSGAQRRMSPVPGAVWRQLKGELKLPPGTRFVSLHLNARSRTLTPSKGPATFGGAYADDVFVTLR